MYGNAVFQIKAEQPLVTTQLVEPGFVIGIFQRFQSHNDCGGNFVRFQFVDQLRECKRSADARVKPECEAGFVDCLPGARIPRTAGNGVQISDVNGVEPILLGKCPCDRSGLAIRGYRTFDRPVLFAPARDAANHDAVQQINDGNDAHDLSVCVAHGP